MTDKQIDEALEALRQSTVAPPVSTHLPGSPRQMPRWPSEGLDPAQAI